MTRLRLASLNLQNLQLSHEVMHPRLKPYSIPVNNQYLDREVTINRSDHNIAAATQLLRIT